MLFLFVGIRSLFYRISMVVGQGVLVVVASQVSDMQGEPSAGWVVVFGVLAVFFALMALWHTWKLPRPDGDDFRSPKSGRMVVREFVETFSEFFRKPQVGVALLFMLLYRLPEAQLVKMIPPFMLDSVADGGLGLTADHVGTIYGTFGVIGLMLGGIVGGFVASRNGLRYWLHPMAWSMSLTCLTFVYLAFIQPSALWEVYVCVFVEQFGYGFHSLGFSGVSLFHWLYVKREYYSTWRDFCPRYSRYSFYSALYWYVYYHGLH